MKGLLMLLAVLLVGCAEFQTLEELELAALKSGDWSAVEQRERLMKKRKARSGASCEVGAVLVCESYAGEDRCFCRSGDDVRAFLDSL